MSPYIQHRIPKIEQYENQLEWVEKTLVNRDNTEVVVENKLFDGWQIDYFLVEKWILFWLKNKLLFGWKIKCVIQKISDFLVKKNELLYPSK